MFKNSLFTCDFDELADDGAGVIVLDEPEAAAASLVPTQGLLDAARDAGFAEGLRLGRAEAAAAREAALHAMTSQLVEQMEAAVAGLRGALDESGTRIVQLVLARVGAAFPALCAHHGGAEVARFTRTILALLAAEPRVVVRVHPDMADDVTGIVAALDPERRESVVVEPREDIPVGDARIGWCRGIAVRDTATLWAEAQEALAALGLTAPVDVAAAVAAPTSAPVA